MVSSLVYFSKVINYRLMSFIFERPPSETFYGETDHRSLFEIINFLKADYNMAYEYSLEQ